jgi:hypothetical protein
MGWDGFCGLFTVVDALIELRATIRHQSSLESHDITIKSGILFFVIQGG